MLLAVKRFRAAQMNGLSLLCGNLHLVIDGDLVLNDHIAGDDCPPLDQHIVVEQNRTTSQLRLAADHRPMLQQAVAFNHRILCHLRTVAHGGNGILSATGDQTRVPVYPGVIAYPDVVFFVPFKSCLVKHFRPMFDKRMLNEGIAVDLRLVENARGADDGSLIDLQDFVAIGG